MIVRALHIVLFGLWSLTGSTYVLAWGQDGHSIIAEVAQRRLSPKVRDIVDRLLNHASLASVASWADDVKFTTHKKTKSWHFVGIPLSRSTYDPAKDCADGCIISALDQLRLQLRCGATEEEKRDALRFIVHLIGDAHQPMHTVEEGGGGNDFEVRVGFCGLREIGQACQPSEAPVVFHQLWDETLITSAFFDWGGYVDRLEAGWLKSPAAKAVTQESGTPVDWILQAHARARAVWPGSPPTVAIDQKYYTSALEVIDAELGSAGIRLARYLDDVHASMSCGN